MASWFSTLDKDPYGTLNPEQRQVNQALGSTLINNMSGTGNTYGGQLNAPIGSGEQNVVDNSARLNAVASNTYNRLGTYDPAQFNTDFNNQIQDPSIDNFKRNIEPLLGEELPSFGTARANVVSRAANDLQNNLLQQRFTSNEAAKNLALNALSGGNTYNQGAMAIQAVPREIQQAGLDRDYKAFLDANQSKKDSLNQALQFLGISTGSTTQEPTDFGNYMATAQALGNIVGSVIPGASGGSTNPGSSTAISNTKALSGTAASRANTPDLTFSY